MMRSVGIILCILVVSQNKLIQKSTSLNSFN